MSASTALLRGRAKAEAIMLDACTVKRITGEIADPASGSIVYTYSQIYAGACRVQQTSGGARTEAGEASVVMLPFTISVPTSVTGVQVEDVVTVTASTHDADLAGRVFAVRDLSHKSFLTARRLGCVERTS